MVILALRVPSNSVSLLHGFAPCLHTSFPICLLKSSCNSYPTSTCLMTNTLRVLESRVFLHYLIKKRILKFFILKNSLNSILEYNSYSYSSSYIIFLSIITYISCYSYSLVIYSNIKICFNISCSVVLFTSDIEIISFSS